jgi:adenine-specific DNA-methyltransferase
LPILQFKGKTAVENYHRTVPHHALEFDAKLSCLERGEKPSLEGNLILEGDNLLALKALLPTHAGRIKCVYIDPPYNTGTEKIWRSVWCTYGSIMWRFNLLKSNLEKICLLNQPC